jgi:protoheme IX farnesyltransferase
MNKELLNAYLELCKPRILSLVLVTTALGYFLGGHGFHDLKRFMITLFGAGMVCAGAAALNHYLERDSDAKMNRTKNRPLPRGIIAPNSAMLFGTNLVLTGVFILCTEVNLLTAFLSLLTAFLYILVYTPMKKISWLNTTIGAIPGAIPPMGGWAAASGQIDAGAWILFLIMFIWQHPHFYAIAWIFKDDYRQAGFKMLPVVEPDGKWTFIQAVLYSLVLIPISLVPSFIGMSGRIYFWGALACGIMLLYFSRSLQNSKSTRMAHQLLRASVIYLPVLLFLIVIDHSF